MYEKGQLYSLLIVWGLPVESSALAVSLVSWLVLKVPVVPFVIRGIGASMRPLASGSYHPELTLQLAHGANQQEVIPCGRL